MDRRHLPHRPRCLLFRPAARSCGQRLREPQHCQQVGDTHAGTCVPRSEIPTRTPVDRSVLRGPDRLTGVQKDGGFGLKSNALFPHKGDGKPACCSRPCAQDNAPPVGVKIQPHRVISRHHLVQFFRDPNELFLSSHRGIYPRGGVASGQENQRRRRKLAKTKCFGPAKSDFTHNVLHSAQRRVLLRDAI